MKTIQIAVAYHKDSVLIKNDCLLPIQVGKACTDIELDIQGDDTGDNISEKNFGYAELTAIYWLWKNSNANIKGLFHYRRFLDLNPNTKHLNEDIYEYPLSETFSSSDFLNQMSISAKTITNLLNENVIITRRKEDLRSWSNYTVKSHYAAEHHGEHLEKALEIIKTDYPQYFSTAKKLLNGHTSYFTNLFIMDSQNYNEYCSWMFDILFKIEPTLNLYDKTLAPNTKKARWAGFLGERLTAIYIQKQIDDGKKVAEFPAVILVPDTNKKWHECNTYDTSLYVHNKAKTTVIRNTESPQYPIISVCVAAFNVEEFIEKCLSSVSKQTLQNIEIIVVNDGSTDNTLHIIQQLAQQDTRIKIINQKNQGPGKARNIALQQAVGKYIHFLDGDDYLAPTFLEKMVARAEKYKADLVVSNHICFDNASGNELYRSTLPHTLIGHGLSVKNTPDLLMIPCHVWDKIYAKRLIKDFIFPPRSSGEDIPFWYQTILKATAVTILREPLYYYRMNSHSVQTKEPNVLNCFNNLQTMETYIAQAPKIIREYFEIFKQCLIGHMMYRASVALTQNKKFRKQFYQCAKIFLNNDSVELSPEMKEKREWFYCDFTLMDKIKSCNSFKEFDKITHHQTSVQLVCQIVRYQIKKLFLSKNKRLRYQTKINELKSCILYPVKLEFLGITWGSIIKTPEKTKTLLFGVPVWIRKIVNDKITYRLFGVPILSKTSIKTKLFGITIKKVPQLQLFGGILDERLHNFEIRQSERFDELKTQQDNQRNDLTVQQNALFKEVNCKICQLETTFNTIWLNNGYATHLLQVMCHANAISATHQKTFGKYKNFNQGKDVVLLATGPSLNNYNPIKNAIHVGVNSAFKFDKVKLDYVFFQDALSYGGQYIKELNQYPACKFYGILQDSIRQDWLVSETDAITAKAERYYVISQWKYPPVHFTYDISNEPLGCAGSVVFAALQFILWTNPKRIYLVGCDCSEGYFDNAKSSNTCYHLIDGWKKMKEFASVYYPETEIISINPVGLKGLFKDILKS